MRSPFRARTSGRRIGQRFDADNGVVTEALIFLGELDPEHIGAAMEEATHYEPTPLRDFAALLALVPAPYERYTFVDVGAGMGRVLLLASRFPFKQICGIEVSRALCEVARENLERWRKRHADLQCRDLRVRCEDALHTSLPRGPAVFYLYNPFGEQRLRALAGRIAQHGEDAYVLYHTPVHRELFDAHRSFEIAGEVACGVVYRKR